MSAKKKVGLTPEEIKANQIRDAERTALVRRPASALAADNDNPWITIGAELDKLIGAPLLKFSKQGEFNVGDADVIPLGTRCVAHADEITLGYVKWLDGKPADERVGRIADKFVPPPRSSLDDTDRTQWAVQDSGQRRDPWQFQMSVPVTRLDTAETFRFCMSSKGGLACIGKLVSLYGAHRQEKEGQLPVIELGSGSYRHSQYGKIFFPKMTFVGWTGDDGKPETIDADMSDAVGF